jgi:hypothetical protein
MKKLRLQVEELAVESFDTSYLQHERGTVEGHSGTCTDPESCDYSCHSLLPSDCCTVDVTCPASCAQSCQVSCNGTCNGLFTCDERCQGPTNPFICPY